MQSGAIRSASSAASWSTFCRNCSSDPTVTTVTCDRCHTTAGMAWDEFHVARDRLIELELIGFQPYSATTPNGFYQVLPLERRAPDLAAATLRQGVASGRCKTAPTSPRGAAATAPRARSAETALQSVAEARR